MHDELGRSVCFSFVIVDVVKLFVKLGVNLNAQDWFGRTALHWAGLSENASLVEYLVDCGGDLTIRTLVLLLSLSHSQTQKTPVHFCFPLRPLIKSEKITKLFSEAFFDAVQRYDRESIRSFFMHVSNADAAQLRNEQGNTALHIAVKAGRGDLVKELLERGFDPDLPNFAGVTPRQLGEAASDRIKEHLGLLNDPSDAHETSSDVPVTPTVPTVPITSTVVQGPAQGSIQGPSQGPSQGSSQGPSQGPSQVPTQVPSQVPTQGSTQVLSQAPSQTPSLPPAPSRAEEGPVALESCGSTREFLRALGLTEYVDTFESAGLLDTHALMRLSEDDFRAMGVKFGHRKKLIEVLSKMDPLYAFLQEGGLMAHYETFKEMGFDNIWSLMSIQESYRERLGLSEEEMQLVLKRRDALVESSKSTIERIPELQKVTDSSESKPILLQIFSSERADEVISVGTSGRGEL